MTARQSTITAVPSAGRNMRNAARYCRGNRWVLLALGALGSGIGLFFGGWARLVAIGAAPIISSAYRAW